MKLYTIGFAKKGLEHFIQLLREAGVEKVIDTRLHNTSQLAGFAKRDDLNFILSMFEIEYVHCKDMAPTEEILKGYKKGNISWEEYEKEYINLLEKGNIETYLKTELFHLENNCLMCSEHEEEYCHRKVLAEYLLKHHDNITIHHLK